MPRPPASPGRRPGLCMVPRRSQCNYIIASNGQDAKYRFQGWSQSERGVTPRYRIVAETGPDHPKTSVAEVVLRKEVAGQGLGRRQRHSAAGIPGVLDQWGYAGFSSWRSKSLMAWRTLALSSRTVSESGSVFRVESACS